MNVNTEAADVLESAAELIARDGWAQGAMRPWGRRCLTAAVRDAAGGHTEAVYHAIDMATKVACEDPTVVEHWRAFCTCEEYPFDSYVPLMFVNDYCLTSGEDAILLAKEAARRLSVKDGRCLKSGPVCS